MDILGPDWNQTGVEGNPEFLTGPYWNSVEKILSEVERKDPFSAPDAVSGVYTNEFILAEELGNAGYAASEAAAVILKMREQENMRQDALHRATQVAGITEHPAHPDQAASTAEKVLAAHS